jgi:hypothetical protein
VADYTPNVDYSSRDYTSIRADLINNIQYFAPQWKSRDSNDFGIVLLELFAYMGDLMSFYIDRVANEAFLATATQRDSVLSIAEVLGYTPNQAIPAQVELSFTNNNAEKSVVVPVKLQVTTASVSASGTSPVFFETSNVVPITIEAGDTVVIEAEEGYSVTGEVLTSSFPGYAAQKYELREQNIHVDSLEIYVEDIPYTRVTNLLEYDSTDAVYASSTYSDGTTIVTFGDGVAGRIPQVNSEITANYRVIMGAAGNVPANTINYIVSSYTYEDETEGAGLVVTNQFPSADGSDAESTESIRLNAPKTMLTVNRAVTLSDYSSLAIQVDGVGKAISEALVFTNVNVYVGLDGTPGVDDLGDPTTLWNEVADDVATQIKFKSSPGISVSVLPPVMVPVTIGINLFINEAYKQASVAKVVSDSIASLLSYQNVNFNQRVTMQSIAAVINRIPGVDYSTITDLYGHEDVSGMADVQCEVNEIPYLDTLDIVASGGIV